MGSFLEAYNDPLWGWFNYLHVFRLDFIHLAPVDQKMDSAIHWINYYPKDRVIDLFYRYGGHIELIRFKEYYRMPRGHEHISFVFSSAFRDIFS